MVALLLSVSTASYGDASSDFSALLDEHWEWRLAAFPVQASMMGDRRYNDQWSDQGLGAIERRYDETRAYLRRVYAIERGDLSAAPLSFAT